MNKPPLGYIVWVSCISLAEIVAISLVAAAIWFR